MVRENGYYWAKHKTYGWLIAEYRDKYWYYYGSIDTDDDFEEIGEKIERVDKRLKVKTITEKCGGCPMLWEGKLFDGTPYYIRYRHGTMYLSIDGFYREPINYGDSVQGVCTFEEMKKLYSGVLNFDFVEWKNKEEI